MIIQNRIKGYVPSTGVIAVNVCRYATNNKITIKIKITINKLRFNQTFRLVSGHLQWKLKQFINIERWI